MKKYRVIFGIGSLSTSISQCGFEFDSLEEAEEAIAIYEAKEWFNGWAAASYHVLRLYKTDEKKPQV